MFQLVFLMVSDLLLEMLARCCQGFGRHRARVPLQLRLVWRSIHMLSQTRRPRYTMKEAGILHTSLFYSLIYRDDKCFTPLVVQLMYGYILYRASKLIADGRCGSGRRRRASVD